MDQILENVRPHTQDEYEDYLAINSELTSTLNSLERWKQQAEDE